MEAFIWIHDILKIQLQNLDLNNIGPEVELADPEGTPRRSAEIQETKLPAPVQKKTKNILDLIAKVLKIVLVSQADRDEEIRKHASQINTLLNQRILKALNSTREAPQISPALSGIFSKIFRG